MQTAQTEGLDHQPLIARAHDVAEYLRVRSRHELQQENAGIDDQVLFRRDHGFTRRGHQIPRGHMQTFRVKIADGRGVDAVKGVKAKRPHLDCPGAVDHLVVKADVDATGGRGSRRKGLCEVALGVAVGMPQRQLAARQHHRDAQPPQHEAEGGGCVGHGIGAVGDHDAFAGQRRFPDGLGQDLPLLRLDIA